MKNNTPEVVTRVTLESPTTILVTLQNGDQVEMWVEVYSTIPDEGGEKKYTLSCGEIPF